MTDQELDQAVRRSLHRVAPEADLSALAPDADLRDALDIDSIAILQFAVALEAEVGVSVPERDYPRLVRLDTCEDYLRAVLGAPR